MSIQWWKISNIVTLKRLSIIFLFFSPTYSQAVRACYYRVELWSLTSNSVHLSSVAEYCWTFFHPMNNITPGLPVHDQLPELTQTHIHWVSNVIQPTHPLLSPFPPALNRSQHQGLFKWVSSSHQVAKVLEFQLQHQSFQWTPRTNLL